MVKELKLAGNPMDPSLIEDSYMNFEESGDFSESMMGSMNPGVWKLSEDKKSFSVDYKNDNNEHETYEIAEISADKLLLKSQAHGMDRTIVLEKAKK